MRRKGDEAKEACDTTEKKNNIFAAAVILIVMSRKSVELKNIVTYVHGFIVTVPG